MSLEELEAAFSAREGRAGERMVLLSVQLRERDVRWLRPRLQRRGEALGEHVQKLIRQNVTWES